MDIKLKSVKIAIALSEETIAFTADIILNGKKAAYARNSGTGGPTNIQAYPGMNELVIAAEEYCKTLPPDKIDEKFTISFDLEYFIDKMIDEEVAKLESARLLKKLNAKTKTHVVVVNQQNFDKAVKGLEDLNYGLYKLPKPAQLMTVEQITAFHNDVLKKLKDGEIIYTSTK